jgi:hypothetical protein
MKKLAAADAIQSRKTTIILPERLYRLLELYALAKNQSKTEIVRTSIETFLKNQGVDLTHTPTLQVDGLFSISYTADAAHAPVQTD